MLRLRNTVTLSVLALAIGLGGTQWLSDQGDRATAGSPNYSADAGGHAVPHRHRRRPAARQSAAADANPSPVRSRARITDLVQVISRAPPPAAPELVPIAMPVEHGTPYEKLRGHLDGYIVVHLSVDGRGQVITADVARSSGDAVLDAHALRSVRGWRFAVPAGYPAGLSADLPMQFSSHDDAHASAL